MAPTKDREVLRPGITRHWQSIPVVLSSCALIALGASPGLGLIVGIGAGLISAGSLIYSSPGFRRLHAVALVLSIFACGFGLVPDPNGCARLKAWRITDGGNLSNESRLRFSQTPPQSFTLLASEPAQSISISIEKSIQASEAPNHLSPFSHPHRQSCHCSTVSIRIAAGRSS